MNQAAKKHLIFSHLYPTSDSDKTYVPVSDIWKIPNHYQVIQWPTKLIKHKLSMCNKYGIRVVESKQNQCNKDREEIKHQSEESNLYDPDEEQKLNEEKKPIESNKAIYIVDLFYIVDFYGEIKYEPEYIVSEWTFRTTIKYLNDLIFIISKDYLLAKQCLIKQKEKWDYDHFVIKHVDEIKIGLITQSIVDVFINYECVGKKDIKECYNMDKIQQLSKPNIIKYLFNFHQEIVFQNFSLEELNSVRVKFEGFLTESILKGDKTLYWFTDFQLLHTAFNGCRPQGSFFIRRQFCSLVSSTSVFPLFVPFNQFHKGFFHDSIEYRNKEFFVASYSILKMLFGFYIDHIFIPFQQWRSEIRRKSL